MLITIVNEKFKSLKSLYIFRFVANPKIVYPIMHPFVD